MSIYVRYKIIVCFLSLAAIVVSAYYTAALKLTFADMLVIMVALVAADILAQETRDLLRNRPTKPAKVAQQKGQSNATPAQDHSN